LRSGGRRRPMPESTMVVRTTDRNGDPVSITVSVLAVDRDGNGDPRVLLEATRNRMERDGDHYEPKGADFLEVPIASTSRYCEDRKRWRHGLAAVLFRL